MSSFVVYNTTKKTSAFLTRRGFEGAEFTCEPNNLANKNNRKNSGSNNKAVGIEFAATDSARAGTRKKAVITVKAFKKQNKPARATAKYTLARGFKANAKSIKNHTTSCRGDLTALALARWTKMNASFRGRQRTRRTRSGMPTQPSNP